MESFAFVVVEYQNERDGLEREKYFRMLFETDFIGSYFCRAVISTKTVFHQQSRIDIRFVEIHIFENLTPTTEHVILFL